MIRAVLFTRFVGDLVEKKIIPRLLSERGIEVARIADPDNAGALDLTGFDVALLMNEFLGHKHSDKAVAAARKAGIPLEILSRHVSRWPSQLGKSMPPRPAVDDHNLRKFCDQVMLMARQGKTYREMVGPLNPLSARGDLKSANNLQLIVRRIAEKGHYAAFTAWWEERRGDGKSPSVRPAPSLPVPSSPLPAPPRMPRIPETKTTEVPGRSDLALQALEQNEILEKKMVVLEEQNRTLAAEITRLHAAGANKGSGDMAEVLGSLRSLVQKGVLTKASAFDHVCAYGVTITHQEGATS